MDMVMASDADLRHMRELVERELVRNIAEKMRAENMIEFEELFDHEFGGTRIRAKVRLI